MGGSERPFSFTHGIIESGKDDPRLVRFACSRARVGFAVLVAAVKGMKSFRILLSPVPMNMAKRKDFKSRSPNCQMVFFHQKSHPARAFLYELLINQDPNRV